MPSPLHDRLQSALGEAFRLDRELSGGGMSRVFLARETALGRDVVVKVLPPELVSTLSLGRFRREIEVTAQLQHPHILPVLTSGGEGELLYYITPFIKGESLRTRLDLGPLPLEEASRLFRELLSAVAFAHASGVAHRDIKPGNVLLSEGHAILADFGIARIREAEDGAYSLAAGGSVTGTPGYLAPEGPRDHTADLYALGALLHELIGKGTPAAGSTPQAILPTLRTRQPRVPTVRLRRLAALISKATARDPATRYPSVEALRAGFNAALGRPIFPRALMVGLGTILVAAALLAGRKAAERPVVGALDGDGPEVVLVPGTDFSDTAISPGVPRPLSLLDSAARYSSRGRIDLAIPVLRELTTAEPDHASGWLALATALTWSSHPNHAGEARAAATRAVELQGALPRRDRILASALLAQNEGRFPDACAAFDSARALRADFTAWFGGAECRRRDDRVEIVNGVARFRGDPIVAARYYEESWRRLGSMNPTIIVHRLQEVLPVDQGRVRRGVTASGETWFGSPVANGDSIHWDLQPAGVRRLTPETIASGRRATMIARGRLRPLYLAWVAREPRDPGAHTLLAELLEAEGTIATVGPEGVSALSEARTALRYSPVPADSLQRGRDLVRLLLRAREWQEAAALADSLVTAHPAPDDVEAEFLIGLAAVTGNIARTTALARRKGGMPQRQVRGPEGNEIPLPTAVSNERIVFGVKAAAGICDESQRGAPARLLDALEAVSPRATRPRGLEVAYLERALMLALDCADPVWTELLPAPLLPPTQAARAILVGDTVRARGLFAALDAARQRGGQVPPTADQAIGEALARLLVADSAGARRALAAALDALPLAAPQFLHNEHPAAALPRAMLLKAELDAGAGDRTSARMGASAVVALWQKADPSLAPALARARVLASGAP